MLEPPESGSRSSVKFGACAIAVPAACHIPSWGDAFANETEAARARPMNPVLLWAMIRLGYCDEDGFG
jgi:hypothetical protein